MPRMDRNLAMRAALTQLAAVAAFSIALAIALPHGFFTDYGWLAGPGAWALSALLVAHALGLHRLRTLVGAAVAAVPSVVGVLLGAHWPGALVAIGVFAVWCGFSRPRRTDGASRSETTGRPASRPGPVPGPARSAGR